MQVVLDINESYEAQFMGVLQSLDRRFFKKVEIDSNSQFMENKNYLAKELQSMENGTAKMVSEDDFWASTDRVLEKY